MSRLNEDLQQFEGSELLFRAVNTEQGVWWLAAETELPKFSSYVTLNEITKPIRLFYTSL
jgi:hypothetical protein